MRKIRHGVALLGCGTVGRGVYELLTKRTREIQDRYGIEFEIRRILVRNPKTVRAGIPSRLLTTNFKEIIDDEGVDVVVEVMGGENPAKAHVLEALRSGRHVITANKALLADCGEEIAGRARQQGRFLGFSAAVTGFHQLIPSIVKSIMITELAGIFNGTSNYILTHLAAKPFEEVLADAIAKGYAEADHRADTEGDDTRNKLILAIRLGFGVFLDRDRVPKTGINGITQEDLLHAEGLGYCVKLLGVGRIVAPGQLAAFVGPALVRLEEPLAGVNGVDNAIRVRDEFRGTMEMSAAGAGKDVTAMAVFNDLVSMAREEEILWPQPSGSGRKLKLVRHLPPSAHYVRLDAPNRPGVLARISKHFARAGINIRDVSQRSRGDETVVSIVFVLGVTLPKLIHKAVGELVEAKVVVGKPAILRIEGDGL